MLLIRTSQLWKYQHLCIVGRPNSLHLHVNLYTFHFCYLRSTSESVELPVPRNTSGKYPHTLQFIQKFWQCMWFTWQRELSNWDRTLMEGSSVIRRNQIFVMLPQSDGWCQNGIPRFRGRACCAVPPLTSPRHCMCQPENPSSKYIPWFPCKWVLCPLFWPNYLVRQARNSRTF